MTSSDEEEDFDMTGLVDSVLHDIEVTDALKEAEGSPSATVTPSTTNNDHDHDEMSGFHFPDNKSDKASSVPNRSDQDMQEAADIANEIIYEFKENKYEHTAKPNHQVYTLPVSMKKKRSSSDMTQLRRVHSAYAQQARTAVPPPILKRVQSTANHNYAQHPVYTTSSMPMQPGFNAYGIHGGTSPVYNGTYGHAGMMPMQSPMMFSSTSDQTMMMNYPPLQHPQQQHQQHQHPQQHPQQYRQMSFVSPSVSTPMARASFKKDYEIDKKLAINKMVAVLMEMDEDNNGELDFEEFHEAISGIDSDILPSESQQIYEHIAYDEHELSIEAFRDLMLQRCKEVDVQTQLDKKLANRDNHNTYHHRKSPSVTPKLILRWAFPNVFVESDGNTSSSKSLHSPHPSLHSSHKLHSPLTKISDILREKDDDSNLFVDWSEFQEAMSELGVKVSARYLQIAFGALLERQSKDEELGIEWFASELTKVSNYREMKPNQILQQFLIAEIPQKNKYRPQNNFSWIDYGSNQPAPHQLQQQQRKKRRPSSSRTSAHWSSLSAGHQKPSLSNKYSMNDMDAYLHTHLHSSKHRQQHRRRSHRRNNTVSLSSVVGGTTPILKPSASVNNAHMFSDGDGGAMVTGATPSSSSIMSKPNCSVVIIPVLKKHLREVDDNHDGRIDWEEFKEVLSTLRSSFEGVRASKMFYAIADISTHEMPVQRFVYELEAMYKLHPTISGDECIEKVADKYSPSRGRSMDASSIHSAVTVLSLVSEGASNETVKIHSLSKENSTTFTGVLEEVQQKVDAIECEDDGYLSKAEFMQFLKECTIDDKFSELDVESIFYHLIDVDRSISEQMDTSDTFMRASCDLLMHKVHQVHADHPNYSARKTVYRVCRRVLKNSKSPKH